MSQYNISLNGFNNSFNSLIITLLKTFSVSIRIINFTTF